MGGTVIGGVVTGGVATSDSTVVVRPGPESKDFVKATYGTVIAGNIIHIENIFGGVDPPTGPLTIEITIFGIQNPYASYPAGNVIISTLLGGYIVDTGESDGSFTPTSGNIGGRPIIIINPVTSGIDSDYEMIFVPVSSIPKNGFIWIYVPDRLVLRDSETFSDGSCTNPTLSCTEIKRDDADASQYGSQIIIIKTTQIIIAGTNVDIVITGITNPRNDQPTGPFHIVTYD